MDCHELDVQLEAVNLVFLQIPPDLQRCPDEEGSGHDLAKVYAKLKVGGQLPRQDRRDVLYAELVAEEHDVDAVSEWHCAVPDDAHPFDHSVLRELVFLFRSSENTRQI